MGFVQPGGLRWWSTTGTSAVTSALRPLMSSATTSSSTAPRRCPPSPGPRLTILAPASEISRAARSSRPPSAILNSSSTLPVVSVMVASLHQRTRCCSPVSTTHFAIAMTSGSVSHLSRLESRSGDSTVPGPRSGGRSREAGEAGSRHRSSFPSDPDIPGRTARVSTALGVGRILGRQQATTLSPRSTRSARPYPASPRRAHPQGLAPVHRLGRCTRNSARPLRAEHREPPSNRTQARPDRHRLAGDGAPQDGSPRPRRVEAGADLASSMSPAGPVQAARVVIRSREGAAPEAPSSTRKVDCDGGRSSVIASG